MIVSISVSNEFIQIDALKVSYIGAPEMQSEYGHMDVPVVVDGALINISFLNRAKCEEFIEQIRSVQRTFKNGK